MGEVGGGAGKGTFSVVLQFGPEKDLGMVHVVGLE